MQQGAVTSTALRWPLALTTHQLLLALVIALAAALRFVGLGEQPLFHDEAYYWVWGDQLQLGHLEWSFYDHPPAVAYEVALSQLLFGDSLFGLRAVAASLGVATVVVTYLLGVELYDRTVGLVAAFLLGVDFVHVLLSRVAFNDSAAILLFALILLVLLRALRTHDPRSLWAVGMLIGTGILVKYTLAVWIPIILLLALQLRQHRAFLLGRHGRIALTLALLLCTPILVWNLQNDFASFSYQGGRGAALGALLGPGGVGLNLLVGGFYSPFFWAMAASMPLVGVLVVGGLRAARWSLPGWKVGLIAALAPLTLLGIAMGEPATTIVVVLLLLAIGSCIRGWRDERTAVLGTSAGVFLLWFGLSLGRLPHWTAPALVALSLLAAHWLVELWPSVQISPRRMATIGVGCMLVLGYTPLYATASSIEMSTGSDTNLPASPFGIFWVGASAPTQMLAQDVQQARLQVGADAPVLVPTWVTYSPIAYYLRHDERLQLYTYDYDLQIGQVWGRDFQASGQPTPEQAVIAIYGSSFLGALDDPGTAMALLLYDDNDPPHREQANDWTAYARTGLTDFEVVSVGSYRMTSQVFNTRTTTIEHPYVVVIATDDGDGVVSLQWTDGTLWTLPQERLEQARAAEHPPSWTSLFATTTLPSDDSG